MEREQNKRKRGTGDKSPTEEFYLPCSRVNKRRSVECWLETSPPSASMSTLSETKESGSDEELQQMFAGLSISGEPSKVTPRMLLPTLSPTDLLLDELSLKEKPTLGTGFLELAKMRRMASQQNFPLNQQRLWYTARSAKSEEMDTSSPGGTEDVNSSPPFVGGGYTASSSSALRSLAPSLELVSADTSVSMPPPDKKYATLEVSTDNTVCFVNGTVPFIIRLINVPTELPLDAQMFTATVYSPSGKVIPSRVWSAATCRVNFLRGAFEADSESGKYSILVRMNIPKEQMVRFRGMAEMGNGVVRGSTQVTVTRNYTLDMRKKCLSIQCEFAVDSNLKQWSRWPGTQRSRVPGQGQLESRVRQPAPVPQGQSKLWGLTCNLRSNNLLYTDRNANQIICITPTGETVLKFGALTPDAPERQRLSRPTGIAMDYLHNRLVICDKDNHRVCFFTLDGQFISSFGGCGHKNGLFHYPWDVAVSPQGNLVITDSRNRRIQFFDRYGNYLTKYTVFEVNPFEYKSQFDFPRGICYDSTGSHVYVTDFNLSNVIRVPVDATEHRHLLPERSLFRPQGITMDACENLLVADSRNNCVRHMSSNGEHLSTIRYMQGDAPLNYPINVTTMSGGSLAVLSGSGIINIF